MTSNHRTALEKVRLGVIGLGGRGSGLHGLLLNMDDVEVPAISDVYEDRMEKNAEAAYKKRGGAIQTIVTSAGKVGSDDLVTVYFYDTYGKELASPKLLGGYKIKR
jgi:predicted dehydrogenase